MPTINLGKVRPNAEGEWTAGTDYESLSLVTFQSEAFMCMQDVPASAITPPEAPDVWVKVGSKGDTGPKGDRGDTGLEGPMGPEGRAGEAGAQGPPGPQGEQGISGEQGPPGGTGPQGERGEKGDTGDQGPQGLPGRDGAKGDKGDTGPQGVKGDTGAQGPTGETGPAGAKGNTGSTGAQGPQGPQGATGPMPALSSAVNSTSTTVAANSYAVKLAYDIGDAAATTVSNLRSYGVKAAPLPVYSTSSLGCWSYNSTGILPSGGTYAFLVMNIKGTSDGTFTIHSMSASLAAGGSNVAKPPAGIQPWILYWRIS